MNHISKKLLAVIGMVFLAWILILAFSTDALFQSFYGWVGFCGGVLSVCLSVISLLLWVPDGGRDTTEINALPVLLTGVYLTVSLLANTIFCFLTHLDDLKVIPIAANALILIAFVAVRISISPYRNRVLHTAAHTAEKTCHVVGLSAKLGMMIGAAQDEAVKKRLKELKEQLDYSTNVTQPLSADLERLFSGQLSEILKAINQKMSAEDVLNRIDAAQLTWKMRNGASSAN